MSKVIVLGGCGVVGRIATQTLVSSGVFSEIAVADVDIAQTRRAASEAGLPQDSAVEFDAASPQSVAKAVAGPSTNTGRPS